MPICCAARTGRPIRRRTAPPPPPPPGQPAQREGADGRGGPRTWPARFVVAPGEVVGDRGRTNTRFGCCAHVPRGAQPVADAERFDGALDKLAPPSSLALCPGRASLTGPVFRPPAPRAPAQRRAFWGDPSPQPVFRYLPVHGAWLNQVERWFSVRQRPFRRRGACGAVPDFARRRSWYRDEYNRERAPPYRWASPGRPLVRGTPFEKTGRERLRGRAWFGTCNQRYEKTRPPPRLDRRRKELATNL